MDMQKYMINIKDVVWSFSILPLLCNTTWQYILGQEIIVN